jgi:hypothetical protein
VDLFHVHPSVGRVFEDRLAKFTVSSAVFESYNVRVCEVAVAADAGVGQGPFVIGLPV